MIQRAIRYERLDSAWIAAVLGLAIAVLAGHIAATSPLIAVALAGGAAFVLVTVRWPWIGLWLYVGALALVPTYVGVVVGPFGAWTPARGLGVLYAMILLASRRHKFTRWNAIDLAVCAFIAFSFVPMVVKGVGITAALKVGMYMALDYGLPYLALRLATADLASSRRVLGMLASWAVAVAVLAMLEGATGYNPFLNLGPQLPGDPLWANVIYREGGQRAQASFGHPISLGMFSALLLPTTLWLAQHARTRAWALAWAVGALAIAGMLIATLSRGPWIAAVLSLVGALLIRPSQSARRVVITALALASFLAVYVSGLTPVTAIVANSFDPGTSEFANQQYRQDLVPAMLELWTQSPVIGYSDLSLASTSVDDYYLVVLLLYGALGLAAFAAVIVSVAARLWRVARARGPASAEAGGLAAVLLAGVFGQLIVLATVSMVGSAPYFFWGVLGLAAADWSASAARSSSK